jgi:hypothetical protein
MSVSLQEMLVIGTIVLAVSAGVIVAGAAIVRSLQRNSDSMRGTGHERR